MRKATKGKGGLEILGVLESKVNIKERFDVFKSVSSTATAPRPVHFESEIDALQK